MLGVDPVVVVVGVVVVVAVGAAAAPRPAGNPNLFFRSNSNKWDLLRLII